MKGDFSRFSFDSKKHYRAVLMQQGRLQLDSDWNEQVQIIEHRYNAFFQSMMGRSGTPKNMEMKLEPNIPSGSDNGASRSLKLPGLQSEMETKFKNYRLTEGVYYIDGLLIENENPLVLDAPERATGKYFYYMDAWTREVGAAEDDALIDPGVGLETTARLKTEWKIRYQPLDDKILSKLEKFKTGEWPDKIDSGNWWRALSRGTLTLNALDVNIDDNRLYRVEVHGDSGVDALFKWSTDNASVCAGVTADDGDTYKLTGGGENITEAFKGAAWIELCAPGETGILLDMSKSENRFENGILTLNKDCPKEFLNMKKALIRRWDGVFPEAGGNNSLARELGIAVSYNAGEFYRSGDYWLILIRDGKIENWNANTPKTPDGVEHHFAALGIINYSSAGVADDLEQLHLMFLPLTSRDFSTTLNADIGGDLTVNGNLVVEGTTTLKGALTVDSSVNITGDTTIGILRPAGSSGNGSGYTGGIVGIDNLIPTEKLTIHADTIHNGAFNVNANAYITGDTIIGNLRSVQTPYAVSGMSFTIINHYPTNLSILSNTTIGASDGGNNNCSLTVHGATELRKTTIGAKELNNSSLTVYGDANIVNRVMIDDNQPIKIVSQKMNFYFYPNSSFSNEASQLNFGKYIPVVIIRKKSDNTAFSSITGVDMIRQEYENYCSLTCTRSGNITNSLSIDIDLDILCINKGIMW